MAAAAPVPDRLTTDELDRLRPYLSAELMEALVLEPVAPALRLVERSLAQADAREVSAIYLGEEAGAPGCIP